MPPQPVILESQNATSVADGATIERRIRISQPDEGRGRCKGSRAWDPRKDFSQPTQPPITPCMGLFPSSLSFLYSLLLREVISQSVAVETIRGELAIGRVYAPQPCMRRTIRIRTMMQPCASAAKLLDDGPILQTRLTSHGVIRVTVTSDPDRQRLYRDRRTSAFLGSMQDVVLMPRLAGRHLQVVHRSW